MRAFTSLAFANEGRNSDADAFAGTADAFASADAADAFAGTDAGADALLAAALAGASAAVLAADAREARRSMSMRRRDEVEEQFGGASALARFNVDRETPAPQQTL